MLKLANKNIDIIKTLYELKGMVKSNFEDAKEDLTEIKNHLKELNGKVSLNTAFRNKVNGGLKIVGILLGSGLTIFILTRILGG